MRPDNKHKAKATREWQKKNGQVQPKVSKKQKEKDLIKGLDSNWDRLVHQWVISRERVFLRH